MGGTEAVMTMRKTRDEEDKAHLKYLQDCKEKTIQAQKDACKQRSNEKQRQADLEAKRAAVEAQRERDRVQRQLDRVNKWRADKAENDKIVAHKLAHKMNLHMEKLYSKERDIRKIQLQEEMDLKRQRAIHQKEVERNQRSVLEVKKVKGEKSMLGYCNNPSKQ
eukprot:GFYU01001372.1.p1 GENE.GFYU01001372.1~~GFYU01001372.1.p1  ORF type:complete len:164 (-),score=55.87 GFYU01001372.1:270-761(-)